MNRPCISAEFPYARPTNTNGGYQSLPSNCTGQGVLVKGRVVREIDRHSYQESVTFGPSSVGRISIRPVGPMDAPALPDFSFVEFSPVPQLPFDFCLGGSIVNIPPGLYPDGPNYRINIELRQHPTRRSVGDMLGEYEHLIELPMLNDLLTVTGLEACDAEKSLGFSPGGYCVTIER